MSSKCYSRPNERLCFCLQRVHREGTGAEIARLTEMKWNHFQLCICFQCTHIIYIYITVYFQLTLSWSFRLQSQRIYAIMRGPAKTFPLNQVFTSSCYDVYQSGAIWILVHANKLHVINIRKNKFLNAKLLKKKHSESWKRHWHKKINRNKNNSTYQNVLQCLFP